MVVYTLTEDDFLKFEHYSSTLVFADFNDTEREFEKKITEFTQAYSEYSCVIKDYIAFPSRLFYICVSGKKYNKHHEIRLERTEII